MGIRDIWVGGKTGVSVFSGDLSMEILGCSEPWFYGYLGVRNFGRLFLGSHGTLVAVSAPFMMPLRDSDIPMNVPFTFRNQPPLHSAVAAPLSATGIMDTEDINQRATGSIFRTTTVRGLDGHEPSPLRYNRAGASSLAPLSRLHLGETGSGDRQVTGPL
jgi:hypothetical protein